MENQIVEYNVTDKQIADWKKMYSGLKIEGEGKNRKESYNVVKDAMTVIKDQRILVEKTRKELKSDALSWGKKVDTEAKRIKLLLTPIEDELKATKQAEDNIKIEAKKEEELLEQKRVDLIKCEIAFFDSMVTSGTGKYNNPSEEQEKIIIEIIDYDIDGLFFMEYFPEIESKKTTAIKSLNDNHDKKVAQEKEAAELKKQKEEQERIAKEQAEAQSKIDAENKRIEDEKEQAKIEEKRKADEAQAKIDEANRKTKAAEEARKKAEKEKADAEIKAKKAAEKAESDKIKAEAKARQDKIDADKKAADKIEQDRIDSEKKAEAEKLEKERREILRPDKEKLIKFFQPVRTIIELESEEAKNILAEFKKDYELLIKKYSDKVMKEL